MCGIAGVFAYEDSAPPVDEAELLRIREHMVRRGPDGAGLWISPDRRVALAHRRLAIIDLSNSGAQPMATEEGVLTISFNGEIYNYRELRRELEGKGYKFHTESDTEVLLHLYSECGSRMVHRLRGMFAFGIWDAKEQRMFLARDPFGIKPLYYADDGKTIRFASQVKALLAGGAVDKAPEPAGSVGFLIWGAVPEPFTLYRSIRALPAGAFGYVCRSRGVSISSYFSVRDELLSARENTTNARLQQEVLAEELAESVRHHLVADVPIGVFLSSGLDSALVTALASREVSQPLQAITLAFREYRGSKDDEAPLAGLIASHYGAQHQVSIVSREDFEAEIGNILVSMDQPSVDGINTYFVSRAAARAGLKVALSGLGGDELFGGYASYHQVPRLAESLRFMNWLPSAGRLTRVLSASLVKTFTSPKFAGILEYGGSYGGSYLLRRALFMPWEIRGFLDRATVEVGLSRLSVLPTLEATVQGLHTPRARVAALELSWYMRNQLLRDADWAGMAHSLEVRLPLVDVALFKALAPFQVAACPPRKADAIATLPRPLPEAVVRRGKTGFGTPVHKWIASRDPSMRTFKGLRGWALQVLPRQPRMFRALALVSDAFGGKGGIAKFNRDMLTSLASMPECAEIVALPRVIQTQVEALPARLVYLQAAAAGKATFARLATCQILRGRYDLVVTGHINLSPLGILLARIARARSVLIVHGLDAWTRHRNPAVRGSLGLFDRVLGVSSFTLSRLASWARLEPSRIRLLPNCVDLSRFGPGPKPVDLENTFGIKGRTVLMTLGRLEAYERFKGFDEILEVLGRLSEEIPGLVYLICGEGSDRVRLEQKAVLLGVRDRVIFAGFVPEERKPDYYRLADAYVMPSRVEGFGIVFLEAMACGIPVMGSVLDGSQEALLDGKLGELSDPNSPTDIMSKTLKTLARPKGVPKELVKFSYQEYQTRIAHIVRETLGIESPVQ